MTVHLASVLAVTRNWKTEAKAKLHNLGVQYLYEQIVVRTVQFLVRYAPKTSTFLVVVTAVALQEPELLQIRILQFLSLARSSRDR